MAFDPAVPVGLVLVAVAANQLPVLTSICRQPPVVVAVAVDTAVGVVGSSSRTDLVSCPMPCKSRRTAQPR